MSDVSDGSGPIQRRPSRASDGGAPVSGALAIVLAVIAVVAGFLILRSISGDDDKQLDIQNADGGDTSGVAEPPTEEATTGPDATNLLTTTTTAAPQLVVQGANVLVANANGMKGSAGAMKTALETGPGFTVSGATDASSTTGVLATSIVYYDTAQGPALDVANSLVSVLGGGISVLPMTGTPPTASGSVDGAGVLLMLGTDKANKTLADLSGFGNTTLITNPTLTSEVTGGSSTAG